MQQCIYTKEDNKTKHWTCFNKYNNKRGVDFALTSNNFPSLLQNPTHNKIHQLRMGLEVMPLYENGVNQFRGNFGGGKEMFIVGFVVIYMWHLTYQQQSVLFIAPNNSHPMFRTKKDRHMQYLRSSTCIFFSYKHSGKVNNKII